ncbi:glycosyltransferase [Geodermatophilus sp. SYSU D00867]
MPGTVSVVVTTNHERDRLGEVLATLAAQTRPADEVVVVGDGWRDGVSGPEHLPVRLVPPPARQGVAAARNRGLEQATGDFVVFVDTEESLTPVAVAAGLDAFARHPGAAFVHGVGQRPIRDEPLLTGQGYRDLSGTSRASLLGGRAIPVHASVVYRREVLQAVGGFDEGLTGYDAHDVHLRIARDHPVASHPVRTAATERPPISSSGQAVSALRAALLVHARHRPDTTDADDLHAAWLRGEKTWRTHLASEVMQAQLATGSSRHRATLAAGRVSPTLAGRTAARAVLRRTVRGLPRPLGDTVARLAPGLGLRPRGRIRLGDLDTVEPVSLHFGFDRGTPLDRHYIEDFLQRFAGDVRGRVLEIADATYSRRFGGDRIDRQDVLHVTPGHPDATIIGDLTEPGVLPDRTFDCIVFTQTLHLIYDMQAAIRHLHQALRPGGVLLLTVPGISQIDRVDWGTQWYWSLTPAAVERMLADAFDPNLVAVEGHGNAFAATAFLQGLAVEEVELGRLDFVDPAYPVIVTARALRWA